MEPAPSKPTGKSSSLSWPLPRNCFGSRATIFKVNIGRTTGRSQLYEVRSRRVSAQLVAPNFQSQEQPHCPSTSPFFMLSFGTRTRRMQFVLRLTVNIA